VNQCSVGGGQLDVEVSCEVKEPLQVVSLWCKSMVAESVIAQNLMSLKHVSVNQVSHCDFSCTVENDLPPMNHLAVRPVRPYFPANGHFFGIGAVLDQPGLRSTASVRMLREFKLFLAIDE
jgi:hypothetical protein